MAVLLGLFAGMLTTTAGMGGGHLLLLGLAVLWDPLTALTVTAPALLLGNAHRLWLYRSDFERRRGLRYVLGTFPGAVVGGTVALAIPASWLHWIMVVMVGLAGLRLIPALRFTAPPSVLMPGGALVGLVSATGGGGGLIGGPLLLGSGLTGARYIAVGSAGAIGAHIGRLLAYGSGGLVAPATLWTGLGLAGAIALGNVLGSRVRPRIPTGWAPRIEVGAVLTCAALALLA